MVSDEDIVAQLRKLLTTVDFQTTTERMIRQQLEEHFGENLSDRKHIIREEINDYLAKQQVDTEEETGEVTQDEGADVKEEESEEEEEQEEEDTGGASLSEALQEFLGVTSMRRPLIVKELWAYIKANSLQDPNNKKNIRLDDKLSTLFTAPLNMLNMNKQLNKHVKAGAGGGAVRPKRAAAPKARRAKRAKVDDPDAPKRPSNFSKPLKISTELAAFLGQEEASRGEITKKFWDYFKKNDLQDPSNRRWILSDDKLKELLGSDRFQGFSLSKLVQRHIMN